MIFASLLLAVFTAGFGRVDITPPLGVHMPGYFIDRQAERVLDPLQMNCVAFSDGTSTAFVVQVDTEEIDDSMFFKMRDAIVEATGCDPKALIIASSHTHDGGPLGGLAKYTALDRLYIDHCVSRAADVAVMAQRDLKPAKLSVASSTAKRISFGRRYLMKNGKVRTNPGTNNPDIVKPVGQPADDQVQVLRIDREGGKPIVVLNFQTHPDVVGGRNITADWPGLTRKVFEAATLDGAHCVLLNGTEGDVNHCNVQPLPGELNGLKRDFDDVDRGYDHAIHMANVIAGAALSVWKKAVPVESGTVKFGDELVTVPAHLPKAGDLKDVNWAKEVWELHEKSVNEGIAGGDNDYAAKKLGVSGMELTTEVARARRILRLAKTGDTKFDLPVSAVSIGEVAFCGFPGEPFNDIGKEVKKRSPYKMTVLSCLSNGSRGYFPFSDSFEQDGYEAATSPFGESVADDLIAGSLKLLNRMHD